MAEEIGYTPSLIYKWIREYQEKGCFSPMKKMTANLNINPNDITSAEDINEFKAQMLDMQMEIDILKETINVFKKRPRHRSDSSHESREGSDNRCPEK